MSLRPAHETKHIAIIDYPFREHVFYLAQRDNGATNGTGLWLGAQCLTLYLADLLKNKSPSSGLSAGVNRPRVIELGSGIGLSALALASMGWDVIATDLQDVISAVLSSNVTRNGAQLPPSSSGIEVRILDWTVPPDLWVWDDPHSIASHCVQKPSYPVHHRPILAPPFDLIISSDTLYSAALVTPLLRTLHELCKVSIASSPEARSPPIYLCVERRDPGLIDRALSEAQNSWKFKVERVPHKRLARAMEKGGARWGKGDWDDVEIWKLSLQP
ncbi:hypothetical protein L226DRAFT_193464 [Lentinus tigrinus ALCF2SS1-7]|uniref:Methyltransferase-domain-containing protein n=1 Tax=Lentinus tigrinus ALCF2SS1-6 TaxID=1328759 RepID=A0A5C2ST66_9APHY|nr:hypothetical protein L227DRAFT_649020 [Lentinus tigrinus ALCF2SS1-6]RPD80202.1 hypothetical protein L226DRAFT_193464 [Lentinus tigrinus ALCF2SS1-7]